MSKNKNQQNDTTKNTNTTVKEETMPTTPAEPVAVTETVNLTDGMSVQSNAIVKADADLAALIANADPDSMASLIPVLPHRKDELLRTKRVTPEEFELARDKLEAEERKMYDSLIEKMRPQNDYNESSNEGLRMGQVKIFQGTGNDVTVPPKFPRGGVYVNPTGEPLIVPADYAEDWTGIGQSFSGYVLYKCETRAYFPERKGGELSYPPGVNTNGGPICSSYDRKVGDRYGECRSCTYKPKFGEKSLCKDAVDVFVLRTDLKGLYRISVSATSFKTCTTLIDNKIQGIKPWAVSFEFSVKEVEGGGNKYFVFVAKHRTSKQSPLGIPTSPTLQPMLELFARQIKTELHLPRLAGVYTKANDGNAPTGSDSADANAISASAGGTDYSSVGSGNV